jgi:hypothetical protein
VIRARAFFVAALVLATACNPPSPQPVAATKLPSVQELAGRYDDESIVKSLRKTLVLRADGSFTLTTIDQQQVTRSLTGQWEARQISASGLLELKVTPFYMPDGKTPVASLAMPIETCGGVLCFTNSDVGVFVRSP